MGGRNRKSNASNFGALQPPRRKVLIEKRRDVIMYAEMWHSSRCLLRHGQEHPIGSAHQFRASLVFTAFTLEAFLNHAGSHLFRHWHYLESLSPKKKLELITEHLAINTDPSKAPWQIVDELFRFRNEIAHGKSTVLKAPPKFLDLGKEERPSDWIARTPWEAFCTESNAIRGRKDVEIIVNTVCKSAKARKVDLGWPFFSGFQTGGATLAQ